MSYGVQHSVPCNAYTSALRLVAASLKICYEMCQTSTVQGFVHCRSSVTQASVKVVMRDALLGRIVKAADRIWMSQRKPQRTTSAVHNRSAACFAANVDIFENNFKHGSIQIKGNFTKLTLHLYFKCIMYYVVLLFSSVHYLLFQVSSSHNSVTVQNRTHVHINFFA